MQLIIYFLSRKNCIVLQVTVVKLKCSLFFFFYLLWRQGCQDRKFTHRITQCHNTQCHHFCCEFLDPQQWHPKDNRVWWGRSEAILNLEIDIQPKRYRIKLFFAANNVIYNYQWQQIQNTTTIFPPMILEYNYITKVNESITSQN